MSAKSPQQVIEDFSNSLNADDLEGALGLYEQDAVFSPEPGRVIVGKAAIEEALRAFLALRPDLTGTIGEVLEGEDLALVRNRWRLRGTSPDGEAVELSGTSADVMRRQEDGSWRIAIDDPWGGAA
jgi:uncharacterized protein (TIGR02246 family)